MDFETQEQMFNQEQEEGNG